MLADHGDAVSAAVLKYVLSDLESPGLFQYSHNPKNTTTTMTANTIPTIAPASMFLSHHKEKDVPFMENMVSIEPLESTQ